MKFLLLFLSCIFLVSCSGEVPNGHVGVFVKSPYFLGENGVDIQVASAGRHYYARWSTDFVFYNIQPQSMTEQFDDLTTKDNMPVDFAAYLTVQLIPEQVPLLHSKFGENWYDNNLKRQFQEMVRNHAKVNAAFALMNDANLSAEISRKVELEVREYVNNLKLPIQVTNISIGKVNPPEAVLAQTIETAAQEQKQKTEVQRAKAELSRADAETNKALADRAYMVASKMTTKEYLVLRSLEIDLAKVNMAKDKANVTVIFGNTTPVTDVSK